MHSDRNVHADDAELVRLMDHALEPLERRQIEAHVAECAACAGRRALLARRSQQVSALLSAIDQPVPAIPLRAAPTGPSSLPAWWRMAAVLALLVTGALAVPTVRAWIAEAARTVWAAARGGDDSPVAGREDSATGAVSFVPAGPVLTVRVPAQPEGTLTLLAVAEPRVSVSGTGGQPVPGVVVLPDELRIDAGGAPASYLVRVPASLEVVRVVVGQRPALLFRPSVPGDRGVFELSF